MVFLQLNDVLPYKKRVFLNGASAAALPMAPFFKEHMLNPLIFANNVKLVFKVGGEDIGI